jgi:hypothetical protein
VRGGEGRERTREEVRQVRERRREERKNEEGATQRKTEDPWLPKKEGGQQP